MDNRAQVSIEYLAVMALLIAVATIVVALSVKISRIGENTIEQAKLIEGHLTRLLP
ncbi:MAG: hypothetical protein V1911_04115 [Candidatus Micrarchaeota archaeon]